MQLPASVLERIQLEFAEDDQVEIVSLFSSYCEEEQNEHERVLLDILSLAKGDKKELEKLIVEAKRDYRNILLWAEYPSESRLDTPEKIDEFNNMLEKLGANWRVSKDGKEE